MRAEHRYEASSAGQHRSCPLTRVPPCLKLPPWRQWGQTWADAACSRASAHQGRHTAGCGEQGGRGRTPVPLDSQVRRGRNTVAHEDMPMGGGGWDGTGCTQQGEARRGQQGAGVFRLILGRAPRPRLWTPRAVDLCGVPVYWTPPAGARSAQQL